MDDKTDKSGDLIERDLGEQPVAGIMAENEIKSHNLVAASDEHITHKMVNRACKGRRLTRNVQHKILRALCKHTGATYVLSDLFNY